MAVVGALLLVSLVPRYVVVVIVVVDDDGDMMMMMMMMISKETFAYTNGSQSFFSRLYCIGISVQMPFDFVCVKFSLEYLQIPVECFICVEIALECLGPHTRNDNRVRPSKSRVNLYVIGGHRPDCIGSLETCVVSIGSENGCSLAGHL